MSTPEKTPQKSASSTEKTLKALETQEPYTLASGVQTLIIPRSPCLCPPTHTPQCIPSLVSQINSACMKLTVGMQKLLGETLTQSYAFRRLRNN